MKVYLTLFMMFAVSTCVYSLKCYICKEQYDGQMPPVANDNSECLEETTCDDTLLPASETYDTCSTQVEYNSDTGKLKITKGCFGSFSEHSFDDCLQEKDKLAVDYFCDTKYNEWSCRYCCQGDLCNINANANDSDESKVGRAQVELTTTFIGLILAIFGAKYHCK
ncbi:UPAR/Ly6 domain-containing protein cold-like isoform X1 [Ptychodera flava]|uniref:UPAR/Ly6 domain-containing protein cold-like isoform X1 n=1 Tax=Ptychodera flava TaxID=63121 RepID=UPI00396A9E03